MTTRVLLTGGSGFIAAHVLDTLLKHGRQCTLSGLFRYKVTTTVRTQEKANKIASAYPDIEEDRLNFAIVEDIAQPGAFDEVMQSDPSFTSVIHVASPFHFNVTDIQKELLDPAILGTVGLLKSIKQYAPSVKRVVITSSFAAIVNQNDPTCPSHTYSGVDWNPITKEQALENNFNGYRASKTFAEKAAWDFVEQEKPNFKLTSINPPMVFGPIVHYLNSLDNLNTSNQRIRDFIQGKSKNEIPATGVPIWIDVRDLAMAHVHAMEYKTGPKVEGQRFFATAGYFTNKEIVEIIRKAFPEYKDLLPGEDVQGGGMPEGGFAKINNSPIQDNLHIKFTSLEKSMTDLVKSLQEVGV